MSNQTVNKRIVGVMAATEEGVIGLNDALPWNYPCELEYFRKTTKDRTILMGKRTYECMSKDILKNSARALVLSDEKDFELSDAKTFYSLEDCLVYINNELPLQSTVFMVGGAETAHVFLDRNLIAAFFLTQIHKLYFGDTYLNLKYFEDWPKRVVMTCKYYTIYYLENSKHQLIKGED